MGFWDSVKLGIENILLHKLRASLTMLGMILGVGAVISMLSIGSGAKEEALKQVSALGINNIWLKSQKPPEPEGKKESVGQGNATPSSPKGWGLTIKDINHLKTVIPYINYAVPVKEVRETVRTAYKKVQMQVMGTEPNYQSIINLDLNSGRFITYLDVTEEREVCVLGDEAKIKLFGPYKDPIGEAIKIGDDYYKIIGVLASKPVPKGTRNINNTVYIPFSPKLKKAKVSYSSEDDRPIVEKEAEVDEVGLQLKDVSFIGPAKQIIKNSLKRLHPQGDYEVIIPEELLEQTKRTQWLFNIVMGSIAGISLLVGGVGIMNIMLATITERTREIGIRRALGARRKDIIKQVLIETLVLTFIGGIIGIAFGIGVAKGIPFLAGGEYKTIISSYSVLAAFSISLLIGVVFGLYPAYKAANISPIEALRYE